MAFDVPNQTSTRFSHDPEVGVKHEVSPPAPVSDDASRNRWIHTHSQFSPAVDNCFDASSHCCCFG